MTTGCARPGRQRLSGTRQHVLIAVLLLLSLVPLASATTAAEEWTEYAPVWEGESFVPPAPAESDEWVESEIWEQADAWTESAVWEGVPTGWWTVGTVGPGPQQGGWREIVISLSHQALWAYEGDEVVLSTYVSTGTGNPPETLTPLGYWSIVAKFDVEDMEGTISDEYYFVEAVPHVMYFDDSGNALHGAYWHNNFGLPMSHGCVNLPLEVASWMYTWAPIGTPVSVIP